MEYNLNSTDNGNNNQPPLSSPTAVILCLHLCLQRPHCSISSWLSVVANSSLSKENRSFYEGKISSPLLSINIAVSPNSLLLSMPSERGIPPLAMLLTIPSASTSIQGDLDQPLSLLSSESLVSSFLLALPLQPLNML